MRHIPNILTILRLLLVPCFIVASIEGMYLAAFVIFVAAAVTDIFDGMIARRWNLRSRLGAILDPAADKALMIAGFVVYTFAGNLPVVRIPGWLTFVALIRDFLIIAFAYLMYTRVQITRFPPSAAGKTSTVLQAVTLAAAVGANARLPGLLRLAEVLFQVTMLITLYSGWGYMRRAALLMEQRLEHEPA